MPSAKPLNTILVMTDKLNIIVKYINVKYSDIHK